MIIGEYRDSEGIRVFHDDTDEHHADYNAKGLDTLYIEEERHFWFLTRKEFIFQQMKDVVGLSSRIIEIGAGTGNVSRYLKSRGYSRIAVGEMHVNGLRYAKLYGIKECYQFDLLRSPFEKEFDAICLFDVLEHISADEEALFNAHKMLLNNGHIILTVPSHQWLWSRDDAVAGHKRRYTKKEIINKLKNNGFEVVRARYFFMSIVPLLFLRKLLKIDNGSPVAIEEYESNLSINPVLSKILLLISRLENKVNHVLPNFFGGSLLIIASKR